MDAAAYLRGHALLAGAQVAGREPGRPRPPPRERPRVRLRGAAAGVRAGRVRRPGAARARRASSTRATGRWRCAWPTVRCSAGHARPPDRAAGRTRPLPHRRAAAGGAAAGAVRAAVSAAPPTTRRSPRRSSWPSTRPRAATAWSTRCCGGPRARATALLARLADGDARAAALKHSPPASGSRGCGGSSSGAEQARALMAGDNEPAELALRANTLVRRRAATARRGASPVARPRRPALPEALVLEGPSTCTPRRCGEGARDRPVAGGDARRRGRSTRSRASGCSTCARRRAARPPIWPR